MSHIRGWDDTTFHNRSSLTVGRLARLKRRELKKQDEINKQAELLRQQEKERLQLEFQKFHELAILETLEQIPKPAPKKSMMAKFVSALTPSWMSSSSSSHSAKEEEDKYGDIMSAGTMDTQASDESWFVTLD